MSRIRYRHTGLKDPDVNPDSWKGIAYIEAIDDVVWATRTDGTVFKERYMNEARCEENVQCGFFTREVIEP